MLKKLNLSVFVILSIGFSILNSTNVSAQESTATSPGSRTKKFPIAKQQAAQASSEAGEDGSGAAKKTESKDGPEEIRGRAEWFYKQRASANGRIPVGARTNALRHMQNMMVAEGKLHICHRRIRTGRGGSVSRVEPTRCRRGAEWHR